ncbi:hypothetical protein DAEQUDRAFT_380799 [Daedalea quercina L-15889]|uniref:Uncharacterized protein n=1 Tax=Daedalea quercina L-15889 TaxID=1314783 RepID=A0A165P5C1_9APHY|nr:hypothetical protein DAEQUDRAFT_380799 [Daedalea quercina L-15889]
MIYHAWLDLREMFNQTAYTIDKYDMNGDTSALSHSLCTPRRVPCSRREVDRPSTYTSLDHSVPIIAESYLHHLDVYKATTPSLTRSAGCSFAPALTFSRRTTTTMVASRRPSAAILDSPVIGMTSRRPSILERRQSELSSRRPSIDPSRLVPMDKFSMSSIADPLLLHCPKRCYRTRGRSSLTLFRDIYFASRFHTFHTHDTMRGRRNVNIELLTHTYQLPRPQVCVFTDAG